MYSCELDSLKVFIKEYELYLKHFKHSSIIYSWRLIRIQPRNCWGFNSIRSSFVISFECVTSCNTYII